MKTLDELMTAMPQDWRERWCGSGACACMGCANRSGGVDKYGYTQEDVSEWVKLHPREEYRIELESLVLNGLEDTYQSLKYYKIHMMIIGFLEPNGSKVTYNLIRSKLSNDYMTENMDKLSDEQLKSILGAL